ncbi:DoxX family protein [Methylobacillus flagellatus]|uniref:DoxX family protein n=1 Tax=Methylobacillus flagellatus TaxID=405 RepID=UPI0010F92C9F|nr:DoxX family protein [Methylobacillus flagellatus]
MQHVSHLAGRILLALIFVVAGLGKLANPEGTAGYMASVGVPEILLWPTIALEVLGGFAIVIGLQTRLVGYLLAAFSIATAVLFHANFADQMQQILFLKNLAIAGGLLLLASSGATALSVDKR